MGQKKHSSLPITFSIVNTVDTKDTRFLNVTIDVLHTGVNYNGSIFNKDVVDNNADSIKNTPILGYIKMEDGNGNPDDFQAHEYNLVINDETGTYQYVYAGHSFGVIPESCNPRWVTKVSSDGQTRDYFEVDGLLWTKFDKAIDIFKRDKVKGQSMELDPDSMEGVENKDGTFTFTNFKFDGCCILSTTDASIQPAMIDSNVTANFSKTLAQEIKDRLNEYQIAMNFNKNKDFSKDGDKGLAENKNKQEFSVGDKLGTEDKIDIDDTKDSAKNSDSWKNPGATFLNKCLKASNHEALVKEAYAVVPDDVSGDVSINDVGYPHHDIVDGKMVVDVAGVEAAYKRAMQQKLTGAPMDHINKHRKELGLDTKDDNKDNTKINSKFSCTMNQMRDTLNNVLPNTTQYDDDGNCIDEVNYWVADFDDKFVYVERYHWTATDNDHEYGRFSYTFDQNSVTATLTSDFEEMYLMWLTADQKAEIDKQNSNYTKLQTEFDEYKKNYSTPEKDVEELRTYKADKLASEHQAQIDAIFAKSDFESLKDNKEFTDFKANVGNTTLEDIENKCYAILGKVIVKSKANFSAQKPVEKVPVVVKVDNTPSSDSAPYGGLFDEYKDKE